GSLRGHQSVATTECARRADRAVLKGGRGNPRPLELASAVLIRPPNSCQYTGGRCPTRRFCKAKSVVCEGPSEGTTHGPHQALRVERFSPSNSATRSRHTCGHGMLRKVAISRQTRTVWP